MNDINERHKIGKIGELLVQLRLLSYNIQAAPPIYDSGNDLIAVNGEFFRAVQVKTESHDKKTWSLPIKGKRYHVLALVKLAQNWKLNESKIYLLANNEAGNSSSDEHESPLPVKLRDMLDDTYLIENRHEIFTPKNWK